MRPARTQDARSQPGGWLQAAGLQALLHARTHARTHGTNTGNLPRLALRDASGAAADQE